MTWRYGVVKEGKYYYLAEIYVEDGFATGHTDKSAFNIVGDSIEEVQETIKTMHHDLKEPLSIISFNDADWEKQYDRQN